MKRGGIQSGHGGASNGDSGVPVAVVDKTIKQLVIEHHGIKAKLELPRSRKEAHRGALATTVRLPAAGKKGAHSRFPANSSDQGWLVGFARRRRSWDRLGCDGGALRRRRGLDGDDRRRREKQRTRKETNGDGTSYIRRPGSKRKL